MHPISTSGGPTSKPNVGNHCRRVIFGAKEFLIKTLPKPQGSDRFEYKVMGSMLELYCDAVVDLLSKGASPETQFSTVQVKEYANIVDFLRDVFLGLHDSYVFFRKFLGLNTVLHKINIFKKINLKSR